MSIANVYRKKFLISAGFVAFIQGAYKTSGFFVISLGLFGVLSLVV